MKKILSMMAALLFVGSMAMAQNLDENNPGNHQQRKAPDAAQMAARRTDKMAKELSLTDAQKAEVLKLNQDWASNMLQKRAQKVQNQDATGNVQDQNVNNSQKKNKGNKGQNSEMSDYQTKLKAILTEEQYNTYLKNEQDRKQNTGQRRGPGNGHGFGNGQWQENSQGQPQD